MGERTLRWRPPIHTARATGRAFSLRGLTSRTWSVPHKLTAHPPAIAPTITGAARDSCSRRSWRSRSRDHAKAAASGVGLATRKEQSPAVAQVGPGGRSQGVLRCPHAPLRATSSAQSWWPRFSEGNSPGDTSEAAAALGRKHKRRIEPGAAVRAAGSTRPQKRPRSRRSFAAALKCGGRLTYDALAGACRGSKRLVGGTLPLVCFPRGPVPSAIRISARVAVPEFDRRIVFGAGADRRDRGRLRLGARQNTGSEGSSPIHPRTRPSAGGSAASGRPPGAPDGSRLCRDTAPRRTQATSRLRSLARAVERRRVAPGLRARNSPALGVSAATCGASETSSVAGGVCRALARMTEPWARLPAALGAEHAFDQPRFDRHLVRRTMRIALVDRSRSTGPRHRARFVARLLPSGLPAITPFGTQSGRLEVAPPPGTTRSPPLV